MLLTINYFGISAFITSSSSVDIVKTKYIIILLGKLLIESFIYFNDCQLCDDDF